MIGSTVSAEGPTSFAGVEPKGGAETGTFFEATPAEVARAAVLAGEAYEGGLRSCSAEVVAGLLDEIAANIEAIAPALTDVAVRETGLPEQRIMGERDRTVGQVRCYRSLVLHFVRSPATSVEDILVVQGANQSTHADLLSRSTHQHPLTHQTSPPTSPFLNPTSQLRQFARLVEEGSWVEARVNCGSGKPDIRRMLMPIGPVAVFGASK